MVSYTETLEERVTLLEIESEIVQMTLIHCLIWKGIDFIIDLVLPIWYTKFNLIISVPEFGGDTMPNTDLEITQKAMEDFIKIQRHIFRHRSTLRLSADIPDTSS